MKPYNYGKIITVWLDYLKHYDWVHIICFYNGYFKQ